jgi:single-strand DNA-binding protein
MSRGLNKVMLIGRVGTDPEMRYTPSGKPVTNFRLAVNRRRRPEGEQQEETDWFTVVCWERLAEIVDQYVTKGIQVFVEGRIQIRRYTGNDGTERTAVDVVATDFQMLSPRSERVGPGQGEGQGREPGREPGADRDAFKDDFDDVPF